MTLKTALGGMATLNQFFIWRLVWNASKNKYEKTPIRPTDPQGVYPLNAQDPTAWMSFDHCEHYATHLNAAMGTDMSVRYAMGFYFTVACGYWFLDVDKCVNDAGEWSPVATWLYQTLAGAAFEYSSSSRGIHLFGRGQLPPDWQQKPAGTSLELYNTDRGVAFGLSHQAQGNADLDFSAQMLQHVCPAYFPPHARAGEMLGGDFEQPRSDWYGPEDDETLIIRMRRSTSISAKFDVTKPTFNDLFDGNWPILHNYYKDPDGQYDESAADFGLASLLAFWTGCHAPRMERIMRQSQLVRPKWDEHRKYLRELTIDRVCERQANVLQDARLVLPEPEPISPDIVEIASDAVDLSDANKWLDARDQKVLFANCVYVISENKIYYPMADGGFRMLAPDQFNNMFARYTFKLNALGDIHTKKAFEALVSSKTVDFPKADTIRFNPIATPKSIFVENGVRYLNSYAPTPIVRQAGDAAWLIDLLGRLYPQGHDAEILLCWMAACIQYPGRKFKWAPVLQGGQGGGKTTLTEILAYGIGYQFTFTPKAKEIGSKFNSWVEGKLLIIVNEMKQGRDYAEIEGELKKLITDKRASVEPKGGEQRTVQNYANFIFTLNDKQGFKKVRGDRRFCVMYSAMQEESDLAALGLTDEYFLKLNDWLEHFGGYAICTEFLATYPINPKYNPAGNCIRAPYSSAEDEVYINARSNAENTLREAVEEGAKGFKGGWICWQRAKSLFDGKITPAKLEQYLKTMGYRAHPGLNTNGWTDNALVDENGKRVRLYANSEIIYLTANLPRTEICRNYSNLQL